MGTEGPVNPIQLDAGGDLKQFIRWQFAVKALVAVAVILVSRIAVVNSASGEHPRAESYFHFLLGTLAGLENDSTAALEHFQLASKADPQSSFLLLKQVEELLNLNRSAEAKPLLLKVVDDQTKNPEFYVLQARIASQESDLSTALKSLEQASHLFTSLGNTMKAREMVLTKVAMLADNHEYAQSVSSLEKYIKQEPEDEISYYFLGKIHTIFLNRTAAKKAYRKALELRPTFLAASKALGLNLELEGKVKEAVAVYQSALRGGANDEELLQKLINLQLIGEDYPGALEYLKQYLLVRPDDVQNQMRAGLIYYKLKNYSDAETIFRHLLETHAAGPDRFYFYLGSIHEEQNRYAEAVGCFENVGANSEYFAEAQLQRANLLFNQLNRKEEAVETMRTAVEQKPDNADLILGLANALDQNNQSPDAIAVLEKASERLAENEKVSFMLGSLLDRAGDFEGSIRVMRKVLAQNMNNAHALNHIGYSYAERNIHLDEAEALLKRAIQLAPTNGFILDSLGWTYYKMSRYQKAEEMLERADKLNPNQPVILEHLADTYQKRGKTVLALEVYKRIMRTSGARDEREQTPDPETRSVKDRVREKMASLTADSSN